MTTLLLLLAGPLLAWGDSSRFSRRDTRMVPTKSGVLGLLAAAQGLRRTDPLEDLVHLRFGVRSDQPGSLQRDFQTAIDWRTGKSMPLSYRYYLADARFVAGVEGPRPVVEGLAAVLQRPAFPLYLGRRSCPVGHAPFLGIVEEPLEQALREAPWEAAAWYRAKQPSDVELDLHVDAKPDDSRPRETRRDVPVSFDPRHRDYGWREVATADPVRILNPEGRRPISPPGQPDWFGAAEQTAQESN